MLVDYLARVHPVDVVGAEDDDVVGALVIDEVERLQNGVSGAVVPALAAALLGGHGRDVLRDGARKVPGLGDVAVERVGFVLSQHRDLVETGVDQVGQNEVDEAVGTTKGHGWLGAVFGQGEQALSFPAGEDNGKDIRLALHSV